MDQLYNEFKCAIREDNIDHFMFLQSNISDFNINHLYPCNTTLLELAVLFGSYSCANHIIDNYQVNISSKILKLLFVLNYDEPYGKLTHHKLIEQIIQKDSINMKICEKPKENIPYKIHRNIKRILLIKYLLNWSIFPIEIITLISKNII